MLAHDHARTRVRAHSRTGTRATQHAARHLAGAVGVRLLDEPVDVNAQLELLDHLRPPNPPLHSSPAGLGRPRRRARPARRARAQSCDASCRSGAGGPALPAPQERDRSRCASEGCWRRFHVHKNTRKTACNRLHKRLIASKCQVVIDYELSSSSRRASQRRARPGPHGDFRRLFLSLFGAWKTSRSFSALISPVLSALPPRAQKALTMSASARGPAFQFNLTEAHN